VLLFILRHHGGISACVISGLLQTPLEGAGQVSFRNYSDAVNFWDRQFKFLKKCTMSCCLQNGAPFFLAGV